MCIHNLFIARFSSYKNNTREKAVSALERDEIENLWLLSVDFQNNVFIKDFLLWTSIKNVWGWILQEGREAAPFPCRHKIVSKNHKLGFFVTIWFRCARGDKIEERERMMFYWYIWQIFPTWDIEEIRRKHAGRLPSPLLSLSCTFELLYRLHTKTTTTTRVGWGIIKFQCNAQVVKSIIKKLSNIFYSFHSPINLIRERQRLDVRLEDLQRA